MNTEKDTNRALVVFAILNWGLGHATRCVPIIETKLKEKRNILIVSEGKALSLLKKEFPNVHFYDTGLGELSYSHSGLLWRHLFKLLPQYIRSIRRDASIAKKIGENNKIELVFSDHRYGFRIKGVRSIFLSHQIRPEVPPYLAFLKKILYKILDNWVNRFDECWIYDEPSHFYAGRLSQADHLKIPCRYIGISSRFTPSLSEEAPRIDILAIVSGLEPQRTHFESLLQSVKDKIPYKMRIVAGVPNQELKSSDSERISFANSAHLEELIKHSACVISRSGYSSIMDYCILEKPAILLATPGQSEQEYLALWYQKSDLFLIADNTESAIIEKIETFFKQRK